MKRSPLAPVLVLLASLGACGNNDSETTPPAAQNSSGSEQAAGDDAGTDAGLSESTAGDASVSNTNATPTPADAGTSAPAANNTPTPAPTPAVDATGPVTLSASARSRLQQGVDAARAGSLDVAMRTFQEVLQSEPRAPQAAYNAGVVSERQGNIGEAESFYQRAISLHRNALAA
jgi:TolA-binding protein